MKTLALSFLLLFLVTNQVSAQTPPKASASASPSAGLVKGVFDDEDTDEEDTTPSATPLLVSRTTVSSTAETPVSGAVENTLILLAGGIAAITLGYRFSKQ